MTSLVERFCEAYNAVVLCDQTSNYRGKYRVLASHVCRQRNVKLAVRRFDILVHIGEISGAYNSFATKETWRVSPDGQVADAFRNLSYVFEMDEREFFEHYLTKAPNSSSDTSFFEEWKQENSRLSEKIPELPFSNMYIAQQCSSRLPDGSVLHLGILNTLRVWNFFETPASVLCYSNTGGFGIDGNVSALIGASLAYPNKLYFGIVGDLAFFYDFNAIGNRSIRSNIRIMLINNGLGTEFKNYSHLACSVFGDDADKFMAAAGHFGNKSPTLVRHYAQDLGFEYLCAHDKESFGKALERFVCRTITEKPILFEVFTNAADESRALKMMDTLEQAPEKKIVSAECSSTPRKTSAINVMAKRILGRRGVKIVKAILDKD